MSPAQHRQRVHKQIFQMYDTFLDQQRDVDWLADARIAALVRSSLYFLEGDKYGLHAYTILPNHVHMLIQPFETAAHEFEEIVGEGADKWGPLSSIMHSLKGYTAHEANQIMRRRGTFWQHESYDHWVRDDAELERIVEYINANPRKAGLATRPQHWFWSSAHDRYLADGDTSGWLNWDA